MSDFHMVVCVKAVPGSTEVKMDPKTNTIVRDGKQAVINPFDASALECALALKDDFIGFGMDVRVTVVSMGIPATESLLRDCIARGADDALLLTDRAFAGADTLATTYALKCGIEALDEDFDLLICGKMAVDGDTAQVGPEVAGQLDIPQVTHLMEVSDISDTCMCVRKKAGRLLQRMEVDLPCVVTVGRETGELDCPTLTGWRWAQRQTILHWDECDLGLEPSQVGLQASPTQVVSTMVPRRKKDVEWLPDGEKFFVVVRESMRRGINF